MLLNKYFALLAPQVTKLQRPEFVRSSDGHGPQDCVISGVPSAWRQVQRTVTSGLHLDGHCALIRYLIRICDVQIEGMVQALMPDLSPEEHYAMLWSLFERFVQEDDHDGHPAAKLDRQALDVLVGTTCMTPRMSRQPLHWNREVDDPDFLACAFDSSTELGLFGAMPHLEHINFWT
ncbi:uncharacterized protein A1O5_12741 [Cladophialophora psammophila CBS 110553]|uniref:Uncharacterized protein n=1 Tax=Cladophialophora psammophila CBS 110553 TaxID=1182543 RepID=W9VH78_9EURO|nr:uncharacterized protein A1O5_12741 [Cladophialophora psammophila CBS 110553]EXJ55002.1 hypothetical protein A1O5_12741 [Cladophialophora psammophila CBS 110553]